MHSIGKALMKKAHGTFQSTTDHALSIEQVSTYLGITPSPLSLDSVTIMGKTYTEHLMSLRMNKALELLRSDPPRKISSISEIGGASVLLRILIIALKNSTISPKRYQNGGTNHMK